MSELSVITIISEETKREQASQGDKERWYAYNRKAVNGYHVRAPMQVRKKGEPTDTALGVTIEIRDGSLVLSYHEAQVIRRHLESALLRVGRILKEQRDDWEERIREEF